MTEMTCEKFYDRFCVDVIDDYIQQTPWGVHWSTDKCFKMLINHATKKDIKLSDLDTFDDDKFFQNVYECTEKGLT